MSKKNNLKVATKKLPFRSEAYLPTAEFKKRAWVKNQSVIKEALMNPIKFWEEQAKELLWIKKWKKTFVHKPPYFQWFAEGKINITQNALDRNLAQRKNGADAFFPHLTRKNGADAFFPHLTRKNKIALIWEPEPENERPRIFTYYDLFREVNKFANALKRLGVKKGDRVGIYLPMIPEAIISMLACARIGAVHAVVFSAFSPQSLKVRLQDNEAKVLITADGYFRRGKVIDLKSAADEGIKETKVKKVVVVERAGNKINWAEGKNFWWRELTKNENDACEPEPMDSEDLLFILYTSGSTGKPKGVVHTCGGYTVQAYLTAKWIFDLYDDDIFWSTADLGWITGHTYSCYGPLLNGTSFLIFEGAPDWPSPDRWCKTIEKYGVTTFYTAPTAIRMFAKEIGKVKKKLRTLQIIASVGEPINETAWQWYFKEVGKETCPLLDTWWQTETGGILITSLPGLGPFKPTFAGMPFPGVKIDILDEKGKSCKPNQVGNLVILPPFSPGTLRGVYKNPEKYKETYFSQYGEKIYFTSDGAYKDKKGLVRIVGRVDDVIKVAGHRISTGELENAICQNKKISESAIVGVADEIKGEAPVAFVVLKSTPLETKFLTGSTSETGSPQKFTEENLKEIEKEIIGEVRKTIGPIAPLKKIYFVKDLPKTRSGKIMRRVLKKIFTGEELGDLSTLANPESVEGIKEILKIKNQS